jgi:hypothetical protein
MVGDGLQGHVDANMSPQYDPRSYAALLVALVPRPEIPDLTCFDCITGGPIISMRDTIVGVVGWIIAVRSLRVNTDQGGLQHAIISANVHRRGHRAGQL